MPKPLMMKLSGIVTMKMAFTLRTFGCSNWRIERIMAANDYANKNEMQSFAVRWAGDQLLVADKLTL